MNNLWVTPPPEKRAITQHGVHFVHEGEGEPLLLIHGLAASLYDWEEWLPSLSAAGFSAYAFDLLGHGESEKPIALSAYTAESAFQHWQRWWEEIAPRGAQVIIGHSLGGYMALEYALRFPERLKALVLINPFYSPRQLPLPLQLALSRPLKNTLLIQRTPYWLFRLLIDLTSLRLNGRGGVEHALPEHVRAQTAWDYKRAAPGIYNLPRTIRDLTPELKRVTIPTLVLWGERDQTLAVDSFQALVNRLPRARGVAFQRCGHVLHQCHPREALAEVLTFLRKGLGGFSGD